MFIAIFNISINAIKFEDITVTFQPRYPRRPIIIITELVQPIKGIITHLTFLNIIHNVKIIKTKTPKPKTIISFLINVIMSSAIIGIPPKWILAFSPYLLITSLISFIF